MVRGRGRDCSEEGGREHRERSDPPLLALMSVVRVVVVVVVFIIIIMIVVGVVGVECDPPRHADALFPLRLGEGGLAGVGRAEGFRVGKERGEADLDVGVEGCAAWGWGELRC